MGATIRRLRVAKDLTQEQLADRAKINRGHLARLETGDRKNVRRDTFEKLAQGLGITTARLEREVESGGTEASNREPPHGLIAEPGIGIVRAVPILGRVPNGPPASKEQEPLGYVYIMEGEVRMPLPRGTFGLIAEGNSLSGDDVHDGDVIIFVPVTEIDQDGAIYAIEIGNKYTAKHVYKIDGKYHLLPSNPDCREVKADEAKVIGRAVRVQPPGHEV